MIVFHLDWLISSCKDTPLIWVKTKLDTKWWTIGGEWVKKQTNIAHVDLASSQMLHISELHIAAYISEERNQRAPTQSYK